MKRYARLVMTWMAFVFGLGLVAFAWGGLVGITVNTSDPMIANKAVNGALVWVLSGIALGALSSVTSQKRLHVRLVDLLSGTLRLLLLLAILVTALKMAFGIVPEFSNFSVSRLLDRVMGPAWMACTGLAKIMRLPGTLGGAQIGLFIFLGLLLLGRIGVVWATDAISPRAEDTDIDSIARRKLKEVDREADKRKRATSRDIAVAAYSEAKALLVATEVSLTFLSLDVVGSTRMKQGEDPYVIEQTFKDYRMLVERALKRYEAYKQTWTPDGQMAAFRTPQAAVDCAHEILEALADFNRSVSKMKTEFQVRLGANCGVVSTDDMTPMEQISDFSIDVAGHMQKYADPNSLWLSEDVYLQLTNQKGIEANGQEVDNRKVYVMRPA